MFNILGYCLLKTAVIFLHIARANLGYKFDCNQILTFSMMLKTREEMTPIFSVINANVHPFPFSICNEDLFVKKQKQLYVLTVRFGLSVKNILSLHICF